MEEKELKDIEQEKDIFILVKESSEKFKNTYLGRVVQIVKAPDYEESHKRYFVLQWNNNFVFMHENEAPNELRQLMKASDIVGKLVPFKAKKYNSKTKQLFVSFNEINNMYGQMKLNHTMLKGTVSKVEDDGVRIECLGDLLWMPREEYYYAPKPLSQKMVGTTLYFNIKELKDGKIIATRLNLLEKEREDLIKELQLGNVIQAKIVDLCPWGARLYYKGHILLLRNRDFSLDFTKIDRVYKVEDLIDVKLNEINHSKKIFVEPVEKYDANKNVDITKYEAGDSILGEVVTIATMGVFVNLEPGVDALCPVPNPLYFREPILGESVMVKITKVLPEKNKLRGKIVSYVKEANWIETSDFVILEDSALVDNEESNEE